MLMKQRTVFPASPPTGPHIVPWCAEYFHNSVIQSLRQKQLVTTTTTPSPCRLIEHCGQIPHTCVSCVTCVDETGSQINTCCSPGIEHVPGAVSSNSYPHGF